MQSVAQHLMWFLPMLWLGMVLAISFLEAPLKFRAPGVTTELGLGIGRLVFRALNTVEAVLAVVLSVAAVVLTPAGAVWGWLAVAGEELPRSRAHYWYIGLESAKVIALIGLAIVAAP